MSALEPENPAATPKPETPALPARAPETPASDDLLNAQAEPVSELFAGLGIAENTSAGDSIHPGRPAGASAIDASRTTTLSTPDLIDQAIAAGSEALASAHEATTPVAAASQPALPRATRAEVGRETFELKRLLGRGGNGEVWLARQGTLGRLVAIKRILPEVLRTADSEESVERIRLSFTQEARTTALLEHPNIVPIHALHIDGAGSPTLGMKYLRGRAWGQLLAEDGARLAWDEFLARHIDILLSVARAVAFAHSRGIIHRDLKPAQVMVGEFGEVTLMDWGLAVVVDATMLAEDWDATPDLPMPPRVEHASNPAGTPAFMAPEQTYASPSALGTWTDVYLLGGVLHHILTGKPPHPGETAAEAMSQARASAPPDFAALAPGREIPRPLSALCTRALARRPSERPPIGELLHELQGYMTGSGRHREACELVQQVREALTAGVNDYGTLAQLLASLDRARGLSPALADAELLRQMLLERHARLALGNGDLVLARAMAGLMTEDTPRRAVFDGIAEAERRIRQAGFQRKMALAASLVLFMGVAWLGVLAQMRASEAARQRQQAETNRQRAELGRAEAIEASAQAGERQRLAEFEQYVATLHFASAAIGAGRYAAAERALMAAPRHLIHFEWAWLLQAARSELLTLRHGHALNDVAFISDARRILTASQDGVLTLWDAIGGGESLRTRPQQSGIAFFAISPDQQHVAYPGDDFRVMIRHLPGLEQVAALEGHTRAVYSIAFHPHQPVMATGSRDGTVRLWSADTWQPLRVLEGHEHLVAAMSFLPGTHQLITISYDHQTRLWDWQSGELSHLVEGDGSPVRALAVSPDGQFFAIGTSHGGIRYFNTRTHQVVHRLRGTSSAVTSLALDASGRWLAAGLVDRTVLVFDLWAGGRLTHEFTGHLGGITALAWSPAGGLLASASKDGAVHLHNLLAPPQQPPRVLRGHHGGIHAVTFSTDGRYVATASDDGTARLHFLGLEAPVQLESQSDPIRAAAWTPDGTRMVVATRERVRLLDPTSRGIIYERRHHQERILSLRLHPSEPLMMTAATDGMAIVSRLADGGIAQTFARDDLPAPTGFNAPGIATSADFVPAEAVAAVGYYDGRLGVYRLSDGTRLQLIAAHEREVREVHPRPGSSTVVTIGGDYRLCAWKMPEGTLLKEMQTEEASPTTCTFDATGRLLAVGFSDGAIRLFEAATMQELAHQTGHTDDVFAMAFHPDGSRVVSASRDGTVRFWHLGTGRELMSVDAHASGVRAVQFHPEGHAMATAGDDGKVLLWTIPGWADSGLAEDDAPESFDTWRQQVADNWLEPWQRARVQTWMMDHPERFLPPEFIRMASMASEPELTPTAEALRAIGDLGVSLGQANLISPALPRAMADALEILSPEAAAGMAEAIRLSLGSPAYGEVKQATRGQAMDLFRRPAAWLVRQGITRPSVGLALLQAHAFAVDQWQMRRLPIHDTAIIMHSLARVLWENEAEVLAIACQQRAVACAYLAIPALPDPADRTVGIVGLEHRQEIEDQLREFGGVLPPPPEPRLVFGANVTATNWLPGWLTSTDWENASRESRDAMIMQIQNESAAYLDSVAPLPDIAAIRRHLETLAAPHAVAPAPTRDARLRQAIIPLLHALRALDERATLARIPAPEPLP